MDFYREIKMKERLSAVARACSLSVRFCARAILSHWRHPDMDAGFGSIVTGRCNFGGHNKGGDFAYVSNVVLGQYTYIGSYTSVINTEIGAYCSIASGVKIGLFEHPTHSYVSTFPGFHMHWPPTPHFKEPVCWQTNHRTFIGNDVWIGECAIVKAGVRIGNGAVVAAGAVVTKDVEPYAIVAGVPAKVLRYRFDQEQVHKIEATEWWNWEDEKVAENCKAFANLEEFLSIK